MGNVHAELPCGDIYHVFGLNFYILLVYDRHSRSYPGSSQSALFVNVISTNISQPSSFIFCENRNKHVQTLTLILKLFWSQIVYV